MAISVVLPPPPRPPPLLLGVHVLGAARRPACPPPSLHHGLGGLSLHMTATCLEAGSRSLVVTKPLPAPSLLLPCNRQLVWTCRMLGGALVGLGGLDASAQVQSSSTTLSRLFLYDPPPLTSPPAALWEFDRCSCTARLTSPPVHSLHSSAGSRGGVGTSTLSAPLPLLIISMTPSPPLAADTRITSPHLVVIRCP